MRIEISVEGRTETEFGEPGRTEDRQVVRVVNRDGGLTDETLSADEMLSQVARLVPDGTRISVTIQALEDPK